ncbi:hypothetical protein DNH61_14305 [Paenibacillus sambharensis]|uniref:Uncharacterized protein n=1 Tax=Paenibacillus sambharensis TaxID=1803190 RepID=A0A2W1LLC0_9BACL|nr:hypothetical protein [Paenibacillus sambharensis]PZD95685.1 hypothetical protein DNH61_14305 [Paenibacillus sambharensis]
MRSVLVFVLFAATFCWLMFSPIYKHVLIVRQAVLQKEVDYLLEIGANGDHGYISGAMMRESAGRLAAYGLQADKLEYEVRSTTGAAATDEASPLQRGVGIELTVRYPYERLFEIDRLIGLTPPGDDERMSAYGLKMSEYVP